jgi:hypothetical protein
MELILAELDQALGNEEAVLQVDEHEAAMRRAHGLGISVPLGSFSVGRRPC